MRNDGQKPGRANGFIPSSFRAISSYLRIVSSGASTVASTVRSAASSIMDKEEDARYDQVLWAGFDKLESERDVIRRILLLGCRSGFQVWDVEEADNVHDLVSRYDGPVSFLQMLPKPLSSMASEDKFSYSRPLLVVCTDGSLLQDVRNSSSSDPGNDYYGPSTVRFYSLTSQSYVHMLKFRSVVCSVRCSPRIIAVLQAAQVHCFNAATLEKEYTILTNPVVTGHPGSRGVGCGPLALGPRWLAYSGSLVEVSNAGRVCPQHLTPSGTFPSATSNGSCVAHYAKESSKHLAAGIVTLGDKGYKKLSRYCSELRPDSNISVQPGVVGGKANGTINGHMPAMDNVGMVIVKDVVSKTVFTQFKAHKSPISALCFDPSGVLLVTASVQGHNINVFRIVPGFPGGSASDTCGSSVHLYRLQRGLTNAIIQDITFSNDSHWIMISSSRGTNHLFAISPFGGDVDLQFVDTSATKNGSSDMSNPVVRWQPKAASQMFNQQNLFTSGPPVTLSVVSRIRNGSSGWKGTVNGAAAVATGKNNSMSGAIAASFHLCKGNNMEANAFASKSKYDLLVFTPPGCLIQYALRASLGLDTAPDVIGVSPAYGSAPGSDLKLIVEATQKWNICQKRREREDSFDIYGENGISDSSKIFDEETRKGYGNCAVGKCAEITSKISHDERNHSYISEAELQMHAQQVPLWVRSEIYFESVITDGIKLHDENAGGEIEIEKIAAHIIEARSKSLVPVFDYLDNAKSPSARIAASDKKSGPQLLPQVSGLSQNDNLLSGGKPYAFDLMTGNDAAFLNGFGETMDVPLKHADTTTGSLNTNGCPRSMSQLQIVNNRNREHLQKEAHLKLVNNYSETLKMENQFEAKVEDFAS